MVAEALRDWLPLVIQAVEPWMSDLDIVAGNRWSGALADELEDAHFGIICLTPENLNAPWIHFEAGALSKIVKKSHVCPYLFNLEFKDVVYPLAQFQSIKSDKNGSKKLVCAINEALETHSLSEKARDKAFDRWWGELDDKLSAIPTKKVQKSERQTEDMLEEMLELLRAQSSKISDLRLIKNMMVHHFDQDFSPTSFTVQEDYAGVAPTFHSPRTIPLHDEEDEKSN